MCFFLLLQQSKNFEWLGLISHTFFKKCYISVLKWNPEKKKPDSSELKNLCVCSWIMCVYVCAGLDFCVCVYAYLCISRLTDMHNFVASCVLMGVCQCVCACVFQMCTRVCVCFFWTGADCRLKPRVIVCCHTSVKDSLSADNTPPCLFHLSIRAVQWQHISIPALNFPAATTTSH